MCSGHHLIQIGSDIQKSACLDSFQAADLAAIPRSTQL